MRRFFALFFRSFVVVGLLCPATVHAATMYWDTSTDAGIQPGDGTWDNDTTALWSDTLDGSGPLLQWVPGNDAHFHASGTSAVTVESGVGANKVVFDGTGYTLSGSELTVGAGGIVANKSAEINNDLSLDANQSVYVADGETLTLDGSVGIGANVTWTKKGEGTIDTPHNIDVKATQGYTHEAGELIVGGGFGVYVTGSATADAVLTQKGGTINSTGDHFIIGGDGGSTDGEGGEAIFNMEGGTLVARVLYSGWRSDARINQTGGIIRVSTLDVAADHGHGWYYLEDGELIVSGGATVTWSAAAGNFVQSGGSAYFGALALGNRSAGAGDGNYTISPQEGGSATLTVGSNGVYVARYGPSESTFNVDGGTVEVNGDFRIATSTGATGTVTQTGGTVTIASNRSLEFGPGTAAYHLDGGTLKLANLSFDDADKNLFSFGGGTLENNGSALLDTAIPVEFKAAGGTIHTPSAEADIRLTGPVTGIGDLTKTGVGTLTLTGTASDYTGALTVEAGTLLNQTTTGGTAVVNGGVLQNEGTIGTSATVNASGTLQMSGGTVGGPVHAYGLVTGTGTISGTTDMYAGSELQPGTGGGTLNTARINVGSSASGTGTLTMTEGVLNVAGYFILGAGQNGVHSTGVLNISGGQLNTPHFYLGWRGNGIVNQTGGTVNVTGTAGIHVATDYHDLEGTYNLDGGTLRTREINTTYARHTTTILLSFGGGTLENNGTALLTTAMPVDFKAAGGAIHTPGGGIHLTGPITGTGDLTKTGGGTLTLSGAAETYAGAVSVDEGTLLVNTSLNGTSGVNVASKATLGGHGTIGGPTLIQGGGKLNTGGSIGTLTFLDDVTLANGAIWDWDFIDTGSYDRAIGDNGAKLVLPDPGPTPAITLNILGDKDGHWVNWYDEFVIFDGGVENFDAKLFSLVNDSDWQRGWRVFSDGQNLVLTAVPEPGTLGMLAAALLALLAAGYRRR